MKKIALKVALWANSHVHLAQMLIFLIATLICTLSFIVGVLLQGTWEIPAFTLCIILVVCVLAVGICYWKTRRFPYKKSLIALIFLLPTYFTCGATYENGWLRQNASLNFPVSTSIYRADDLPKHRKLVRKFIRKYKSFIKTYINKHYKGRKKYG
ncbi:MAG: hypothetical protein NZ516_05820 [Raineya sp.]|nr:hypothetical protein [Raineya sp.]